MQQKEAITTQRRTRTPEQARAALMRLCARAEKCEGDARRLMRGWGFIDDARYTEAFVREKLHLSGWGVYKIRAALQRKGIAARLIDAALGRLDREGMAVRLREQLQRKIRTVRSTTPRELKTKLIRYGLSLGYEYDSVFECVSELVKNDEETCYTY